MENITWGLQNLYALLRNSYSGGWISWCWSYSSRSFKFFIIELNLLNPPLLKANWWMILRLHSTEKMYPPLLKANWWMMLRLHSFLRCPVPVQAEKFDTAAWFSIILEISKWSPRNKITEYMVTAGLLIYEFITAAWFSIISEYYKWSRRNRMDVASVLIPV